MYSIVKRRYHAGSERPEKEFLADPGVQGEVSSCSIAGRFVLSVGEWGDASGMAPLLPDLYDATIAGVRRGILVLTGVEYPDGPAGPAFPQEWRIKCLGEYPSEAPPTSRPRNASRM